MAAGGESSDAHRAKFLEAKRVEWEKQVAPKCAQWIVLDPQKFSRNTDGTIVKLDDGSLLSTGDNLYRDLYRIDFKTDLQNIIALRLETLPDPRLEAGGPGRSPSGGFILHEFTLSAAEGAGPARDVAFGGASADFAAKGSVAEAIDGKNNTGWTIENGGGKYHEAVFRLKETLAAGPGTTLSVGLLQNYHQQENLGRIRISATTDAGAGGRVGPAG